MADPWKLDEEEKKRRRRRKLSAAKRKQGNKKVKDVKKKPNYTLVKGAKKPLRPPPKKGPIGRKLKKTTPAKPNISTSAKAIKARANKRRNPDNTSKDVKKKPNYTLRRGV